MDKKRVASLIVSGMLVVGVGAAFAEDDPVVTNETVPTTLADETTDTTVAETTDTTVAEQTTDTTVAETTDTTVAEDNTEEADVVEGDAPGNSAAAHNHDCDEAWGNHGAWVSANAKARKTGEEVSCDGPAAADEPAAEQTETEETDPVVDETDTVETADVSAQSAPAKPGKGKGRDKNK